MPYDNSKVTVMASQEAIRRALKKARANRITFVDDQNAAGYPVSVIEFEHHDYLIRLRIPHRVLTYEDAEEKTRYSHKSVDWTLDYHAEQEERRIWRVLNYQIKTRMEAISEGLETFEQSFLPHIVDPATNVTIWESVEPAMAPGGLQLGGRGLLALAAGAR